MRKYVEFMDDPNDKGNYVSASEQLNELAKKHTGVKVEGYQIARYEQINLDRTYILASYEVNE